MTAFNSFNEVYQDACQEETSRKPMLLIGNGFSQECCKANGIDDVFSYQNLMAQMETIELKGFEIKEIFKHANSENIENVLNVLNQAKINQSIIELVKRGERVADELEYIIDKIKTALINAILKIHPVNQYHRITEVSYSACAHFLRHFSDVYTTNYDLLLYWAHMKDQELKANHVDGFWICGEGKVYWDKNIKDSLSTNKHRVCYLHGGLHLFRDSIDSRIPFKSTADGGFIIDRIQNEIKMNHYPFFVTEGNYSDKLEKIYQNEYLTDCYNSLSGYGKNTEKINTLFTYGISFNNDDHILSAISKNNSINALYIGTYESNLPQLEKIKQVLGKKMQIHTYNSTRVNPWGENHS